jgi:hypothetical protein
MRVENHFRSHVFISPTKSGPFGIDIFRSPSEITQFNVPKLIDQQILGFYIPVHDVI